MVEYICVAFKAHRQSVSVPSARVRLNPYPALHIGPILAMHFPWRALMLFQTQPITSSPLNLPIATPDPPPGRILNECDLEVRLSFFADLNVVFNSGPECNNLLLSPWEWSKAWDLPPDILRLRIPSGLAELMEFT
jgi:hypothetical protein